jgi:E3 ubiquitin-protein ligase synoviolin
MPLNEALRQRKRNIAATVIAHRVLLYTFVSTAAVSTTVVNALQNYNNLYSVAIYLSKSSRSVVVYLFISCPLSDSERRS